jgi:hypothetical protein
LSSTMQPRKRHSGKLLRGLQGTSVPKRQLEVYFQSKKSCD